MLPDSTKLRASQSLHGSQGGSECGITSSSASNARYPIPGSPRAAATVALGYPARPLPTRLRRAAVSDIVFSEAYGQPLFAS